MIDYLSSRVGGIFSFKAEILNFDPITNLNYPLNCHLHLFPTDNNYCRQLILRKNSIIPSLISVVPIAKNANKNSLPMGSNENSHFFLIDDHSVPQGDRYLLKIIRNISYRLYRNIEIQFFSKEHRFHPLEKTYHQAFSFPVSGSNEKVILGLRSDLYTNQVIIYHIVSYILDAYKQNYSYLSQFDSFITGKTISSSFEEHTGHLILQKTNFGTLNDFLEKEVLTDNVVNRMLKKILIPLFFLQSPEFSFVHGNLIPENIHIQIDIPNGASRSDAIFSFLLSNFECSSITWKGIRFYNGFSDIEEPGGSKSGLNNGLPRSHQFIDIEEKRISYPLLFKINGKEYYQLDDPLQTKMVSRHFPTAFYQSYDLALFFYSLLKHPPFFSWVKKHSEDYLVANKSNHLNQLIQLSQCSTNLFDINSTDPNQLKDKKTMFPGDSIFHRIITRLFDPESLVKIYQSILEEKILDNSNVPSGTSKNISNSIPSSSNILSGSSDSSCSSMSNMFSSMSSPNILGSLSNLSNAGGPKIFSSSSSSNLLPSLNGSTILSGLNISNIPGDLNDQNNVKHGSSGKLNQHASDASIKIDRRHSSKSNDPRDTRTSAHLKKSSHSGKSIKIEHHSSSNSGVTNYTNIPDVPSSSNIPSVPSSSNISNAPSSSNSSNIPSVPSSSNISNPQSSSNVSNSSWETLNWELYHLGVKIRTEIPEIRSILKSIATEDNIQELDVQEFPTGCHDTPLRITPAKRNSFIPHYHSYKINAAGEIVSGEIKNNR